MSQFKFEGDLSLSPQQTEFVAEVLRNRGYNNEKVIIEPVGKVDDNFVANVKRIVVENDGKSFKMIAKVAPSNEQMRDAMKADIMFKNEYIMYTKVFPNFTELENEAGVPEAERFMYPKCYGTFMDAPNEIILLEDLKIAEYAILDKQKSFTDEEVRLVLKSFAKLHALSYALKYKKNDDFNSLCGQLQYIWMIPETRNMMEMMLDQYKNDLANILDNNHEARVTEALGNFLDLVEKNYKYDTASKFSVIQHGDAWTNNIMFRFEDGKPVKCCIVDYQVSNQNSPVSDLHYMIFNCTDYQARSEHYHDWIEFYHRELGYNLDNFGLKINFVYPRDQLDADLKRLSKVAFISSVIMAGIAMRETHEAAKFKEDITNSKNFDEIMDMNKLSLMEETSIIRYKTRLDELIKSFVELGYL